MGTKHSFQVFSPYKSTYRVYLEKCSNILETNAFRNFLLILPSSFSCKTLARSRRKLVGSSIVVGHGSLALRTTAPRPFVTLGLTAALFLLYGIGKWWLENIITQIFVMCALMFHQTIPLHPVNRWKTRRGLKLLYCLSPLILLWHWTSTDMELNFICKNAITQQTIHSKIY